MSNTTTLLKRFMHWFGAKPAKHAVPKNTLVLGGGVALGIAHIGVIQVLEENNMGPDFIVGTSAGAMVGALYCSGLTTAQIMDAARGLSWSKLGKLCMPKMGLMDGARLEKWMDKYLPVKSFEEMKKPFAAVATNLNTCQKEIITSGPIARAVHASCAIPGIFNPVKINDQVYVDGGLVEEIPVQTARELGARTIIAVQLLNAEEYLPPPSNIFDVIMRSKSIRSRRLNALELADADIVVIPQTGHISLYDFKNTDALVALGRMAATEALHRYLQKNPAQAAAAANA